MTLPAWSFVPVIVVVGAITDTPDWLLYGLIVFAAFLGLTLPPHAESEATEVGFDGQRAHHLGWFAIAVNVAALAVGAATALVV